MDRYTYRSSSIGTWLSCVPVIQISRDWWTSFAPSHDPVLVVTLSSGRGVSHSRGPRTPRLVWLWLTPAVVGPIDGFVADGHVPPSGGWWRLYAPRVVAEIRPELNKRK